MELTSSSDPKARYVIVAPLFFNDDVVGVLDGRYISGAVPRRRLVGFRQENRTSFKHPIIGLAIGLAMVVISIAIFLAWLLTLADLHFLLGSIFMFFFGVYLLWGVLRRHDEPWVVFLLEQEERALPLKAELSPDHVALLERICAEKPER